MPEPTGGWSHRRVRQIEGETDRKRGPSEAQQDEREEARKQQGDCPVCESPLDGVISLRNGEYLHWECASDEAFQKVDADHYTGDTTGDAA